LEKFVYLTDLHWGYERRGGHKVPLHDIKALTVALNFIKDFKPDHIILGGDILDCGAISHHNHGKPGAVEGFRLMGDAKELQAALITPLEALKTKSLTYITGNHEDWLTDLTQQIPALEGIVDVKSILDLSDKWQVVPCGDTMKLGKLVFMHGDQIKGGEHSAKWATVAYEANVRFGHHHTFQVYSKTTALESNGHTGIAVPCLCKKNPGYGGGAPNRWMQGFLWGYVNGPKGTFNDYVSVIINGTATINGKVYHG
jgi:UDP-2,3-diacylglucosamine pyrophosphatase LpxH